MNQAFNYEVNKAPGHLNVETDRLKPRWRGIQPFHITNCLGTLPGIIDQEVEEPVNWVVEYRIPLDMLSKYSPATDPAPGIAWMANFYKIDENNSNLHNLTWSAAECKKPHFHVPGFFGTLRFH